MRRFLFPTVATALALGCSDPNEPDHSGSMSFDYRGSLPDSPSGSFTVAGVREPFPEKHVDGAGGFTSGTSTFEYTSITGERRDGPRVLEIVIMGPHSVGELPMCDHSQPVAAQTHCVARGHWTLGNPPGFATSLYDFGSVSDDPPPYPEMRVTITSLTDRRMTGTFEGFAVGNCATCSANGVPDTMHFTNGKFDVPYR